jgi:O-antigen/teichoic acid export membrane protein
MTSRPLPSSAAEWAPRGPVAAAVERPRLARLTGGQRVFVAFTLSVAALNAASLVSNVFAFRWIDPASMGVWHTLLLAGSYLTIVRLGVINGMGRELPFALGSGDVLRAQRIAATALACNAAASAVVGAAFLAPLAWSSGETWRLGLAAMAVVGASNLYLAYLQATFRSDADFARLTRVHLLQATLAALMPVAVYAFGFAGLCLHAALQSLLATGYAHALRPLRVAPRFEPGIARELLATGLPLFAAGYLQLFASGFDRVILLERGGVEAVGYYAPALAVLGALGVVPGAVATYVYPRMSYALGQGRTPRALGRMAFTAAAVSVAAGVPLALLGWFASPPLIERYFPQYGASVPAVRWSLVAGVLWGLASVTTLLGSLKAWRSLALYIGVLLVARWTLPWLLSGRHDPLVGVARGNACAAAVVGALSLLLALRAARQPAGVAA